MTKTKNAVEQRIYELTKMRDDIEAELRSLRYSLHKKRENEALLTAEELRKLLTDDPETGHFFWKKRGRGRTVGARAGTAQGADGYRAIKIKGKLFKEQRLAWLYITGEWPELIIDHDNDDKAGNHFENLNHVCWAKNNLKRDLLSSNTSGYRGVSLHKSGRWRASLYFNGRQVYHKLFGTKEEAAKAYAEQRMKYHGT